MKHPPALNIKSCNTFNITEWALKAFHKSLQDKFRIYTIYSNHFSDEKSGQKNKENDEFQFPYEIYILSYIIRKLGASHSSFCAKQKLIVNAQKYEA